MNKAIHHSMIVLAFFMISQITLADSLTCQHFAKNWQGQFDKYSSITATLINRAVSMIILEVIWNLFIP